MLSVSDRVGIARSILLHACVSAPASRPNLNKVSVAVQDRFTLAFYIHSIQPHDAPAEAEALGMAA